MQLSERLRRFFGPEQTPLNPTGSPGIPGEVSIVNEGQRRGKLPMFGIAALGAVVIFTVISNFTKTAPSATPSAAPKSDVHTSAPTTTEAVLNALKHIELPKMPGSDQTEVSDGDKERAKMALAAYERQNAASSSAGATADKAAYSQSGQGQSVAEDPIVQEKKKQRLEEEKREHSSLFANPAFAVGSASAEASADKSTSVVIDRTAVPPPDKEGETLRPSLAMNKDDEATDCVDVAGSDNETRYCLPQGTPIPARLVNRAIGDLPGPVKGIVARDVYSRDRQHMLIPAGTELIGQAHALGSTWQERLSMSFDRMLLPDGRSITLKEGLGLDQYGAMGVKDKVNRHITGKIMTVLSLGALSTLSAAGTSAGYNAGYSDVYRQNVSQQTAQVGQQMMQKQLNRPNSLTIEEGKIYELWLSEDIHVQEWNRQ